MSRNDISRSRNWSHYSQSLVKRGSINLWLDEKVIQAWHKIDSNGKKGSPRIYSDTAIQCAIQIRSVFKLPLRATEGYLLSLFKLLNLNLAVPNYSTLSRRLGELKNPKLKLSKEPARHIVIDSTGLKVYGEGEWKVRVHGYNKRRTWRKLHLGINADNQEIVSVVLSTNDFKDNELLKECMDQIPAKTIISLAADGAYDAKNCYDYLAKHNIKALIPPQHNAKLKQHGNSKLPALARDKNLRAIRKLGRKNWRLTSGYSKRSLAETGMYRYKTIFGGSLQSRKWNNQAHEVFIKCNILNKFRKM